MEHRPPLSVIEPATYTIRVQGHLDATWSERLGGMRITVSGTGRRAVIHLVRAPHRPGGVAGSTQRALRARASLALRRLSRAAVARDRFWSVLVTDDRSPLERMGPAPFIVPVGSRSQASLQGYQRVTVSTSRLSTTSPRVIRVAPTAHLSAANHDVTLHCSPSSFNGWGHGCSMRSRRVS